MDRDRIDAILNSRSWVLLTALMVALDIFEMAIGGAPGRGWWAFCLGLNTMMLLEDLRRYRIARR